MMTRKMETAYIATYLEMTQVIDIYDGEECDTEIELKGKFVVSGARRKEFAEKLKELIGEYSI